MNTVFELEVNSFWKLVKDLYYSRRLQWNLDVTNLVPHYNKQYPLAQ